ncbi:MAG TPA: hypothetical protein VHB20_14785 [Verrucomicrobiae bacterium]|jgi:hypothetical protein|nr:hypothetical protein [Verrucomicrobiae bacterium]
MIRHLGRMISLGLIGPRSEHGNGADHGGDGTRMRDPRVFGTQRWTLRRQARRRRTGITRVNLSPRMRLADVIKAIEAVPMGGTDCAMPMVWATRNKLNVSAFITYTDSETWAGNIHPAQALRQYRNEFVGDAKAVVVGMTSNGSTLADPNDCGMLDVAGFDTSVPAVIADFVPES